MDFLGTINYHAKIQHEFLGTINYHSFNMHFMSFQEILVGQTDMYVFHANSYKITIRW